MYKRALSGWLKHLDFILWDMLCLQAAFYVAYVLRMREWMPYTVPIYRTMALLLMVVDLLVAVTSNTMKNVLKRGHLIELRKTLKQCLLTFALMLLWMFSLQRSESYSRIVLFLTLLLHIVLAYSVRVLWKKLVRSRASMAKGSRSLLVVLDPSNADEILDGLKNNPVEGYHLTGVVLFDNPDGLTEIAGYPIVCPFDEAASYICREWIDGVFISIVQPSPRVRTFIDQCAAMGLTIHYHVLSVGVGSSHSMIEKMAGTTVLTLSANVASVQQLIAKRALDIVGGLVGSVLALVIMAIFGPRIKKASPGPILYRSERIGQNGRRFKMVKIRSMRLDADAHKAELMDQNRVKDGMMFKLDFDPRIIGNEILPDGTRKTGIGEFIRRTSLDEFPQFFNVLKGEMSLVGTRPPTPDEWEKYEFHHRARLAAKPGITGMWQISGRSEITDFEQVVKLDTEYIRNWSIGLDLKILFKTFGSVLRHKGAM